MDLRSAVDLYCNAVKEFGHPMPLSQFGLSKQELESLLAAWDEDYHLNRHFELIAPEGEQESVYLVNGVPSTAIVFKESIRHALE